MKHLKLTIIITLLYLSVSAQIYFPLPDSNAIWTTLHYTPFGSAVKKNGIFGDTVFNGITYKKVYESYDYNFNLATAYFKGAIRESNKKVYLMNTSDNTESVLYDFTLNIGDTAKVKHVNGFQFSLKVSAIDYISIYGQNHKRWKFNSAGLHTEEYWIEGIGSSFGLMIPLFTGSDACFNLLCASQNNNLIYEYAVPANPVCYVAIPYDCDGVSGQVSVSELSSKNNTSVVFPNPFSNSAILKTNMQLHHAILKIYDLLEREAFTQINLNGTEVKINKENLSAGNYYYKLIQNDALISTGKLVIE
jgi:hypothetical protein